MAKKIFNNPEDASPLYHKLAQTLRERISTGEYPPGSKIPTEPKLCEEFGLSRITVRQAVEILETKGFVERQQGRGTFVRTWESSGKGWTIGQTEGIAYFNNATRLELTSKRKIKASKRIADDLEIRPGDAIYTFKGIRDIANEKSRGLFRGFTVEAIGRKISIKPTEGQIFEAEKISHRSLYLEIEKISRERFTSIKQFIYAVQADEKTAEAMGVQPGSSLLAAKRIFRTEAETPLLVTFNYFPGEIAQTVSVIERR
ncbi:MAG: GntR family transcriptional regulator [Deltaproteobacteria bacterium]|nr:GntR family transcriptional regulator [Deltaproteobacteria bacterium]MBT6611296.1 GntR family transcriptional regulator [Deltaproteobacteria bacterium]